jgi:aminoglycoside phosphotransferase (APT) family kinase protein
MEFVREHTTIPVPKVYSAVKHKGHVYILMERIDGTMAGQKWNLRTEESKKKIFEQLSGMIEQLRKLPPPDGFVGVANVDGGAIYDSRLPKQLEWGPFDSISKFHSALLDDIDFTATSASAFPDLQELVEFYNDQPWPKPVFTHGDLSSLNILCKEDRVVGIIDWETAGWYPDYWEYVSAWNVNPQNTFWREEIDKFLPPLPHARDMDTTRRKYFADY